jgi:hypothetical protein
LKPFFDGLSVITKKKKKTTVRYGSTDQEPTCHPIIPLVNRAPAPHSGHIRALIQVGWVH